MSTRRFSQGGLGCHPDRDFYSNGDIYAKSRAA